MGTFEGIIFCVFFLFFLCPDTCTHVHEMDVCFYLFKSAGSAPAASRFAGSVQVVRPENSSW